MRAAEVVAGAMRAAVQATITERRPEPAREAVDQIVAAGSGSATVDNPNPAAVLTTYLLVHWLNLVREKLADRPERVSEILGWVEENLGRRYRLRAGYPAAALVSSEGLEEIAEYAPALGSEFMPAIIWLLAGAVARYGDGDADWITLRPAD